VGYHRLFRELEQRRGFLFQTKNDNEGTKHGSIYDSPGANRFHRQLRAEDAGRAAGLPA